MLNYENEKKRLDEMLEKEKSLKAHSVERWKLNEQIKVQRKIVIRAEKEKNTIPKNKLDSVKYALGAIIFSGMKENDFLIMLENKAYNGVKLQYSTLCTLTQFYNQKYNKNRPLPVQQKEQPKEEIKTSFSFNSFS